MEVTDQEMGVVLVLGIDVRDPDAVADDPRLVLKAAERRFLILRRRRLRDGQREGQEGDTERREPSASMARTLIG
jgi:hypothetical protein